MKHLVCDYLVIGSGAAALAFLDTIFVELPDKKVIIVDKKPRPGGHWVDDYDFVQLHQPSVVYGLASKQLEGNWLKLLSRFMLPWKHRASKKELLDYFQEFVDSNSARGRLQYFPECAYDLEQKLDGKNANFASLDGKISYTVEIRDKLVNGVQGECVIPSLTPPAFSVDAGINLMTPNQLFELLQRESKQTAGWLSMFGLDRTNGTKDRQFIVLGAGKTAMDTVVFLQSAMGIPPSNISWVIPNDVWMLARDKGAPSSYPKALLENDNDKDKACLALEAQGLIVRLDPEVKPTRFRFPVVGKDEIKQMRNVQHKIRRGRVSSIRKDSNVGAIVVAFEKGKEDWVLPEKEGKEYIFVHCTSPGPFNGKTSKGNVFRSDQEMVLQLLFFPPISISMSCIGKLESARQNATLDIDFCRKLLENDAASPNEALRLLIKSVELDPDAGVSTILDELRSTITLAVFISILDKDPMVGYNWLKSNRLSMLSIPGFKVHAVEDLELIVEKGKVLGSPPDQLEIIQKVAKKLEPLRGM